MRCLIFIRYIRNTTIEIYGAKIFDLWGLSFIQNMYRSKVPSKFVLQLIKAGGPNLIPPSYNKIIFERFNDFIAELHNLT